MVGATEKLKRALVSLILSLARAYGCAVVVDRECSESEVGRGYRQLSRYVHPDKCGGCAQDQKRLNEAHDAWRQSRKKAPGRGGDDPFGKQIPMARAVPMWAGLSGSGVAELLIHEGKKATVDEWVAVVRGGKVTAALRRLKPRRGTGPWIILCDNERFLTANECMAAYAAKNIELWKIPPRSPDLNPIEKFWGWLRRERRRRDLKDLQAKRPVLSKAAFKARVRAVLRAQKTQRVASRIASGLFGVCQEVKAKRGAASRS